MKIIDIVNKKIVTGEPVFSLEIIPPRNGALLSKILEKVSSLNEVRPDFISITKGAGGSLRGGTVPIAYLIKEKNAIETVAHLTCIDTSIEELENSLVDHWYLGIENILALRGDPPTDAAPGYKEFRGLHYHTYAKGLVEQINLLNKGLYLTRKSDFEMGAAGKEDRFRSGKPTSFCVSVAGHPEGHPECPDADQALLHLKQKVDAGADLVFTQMVFSAEIYKNFVDRARKKGINIPIIPGIRPITGYDQIERVEDFFKVTVDERFKKELKNLENQDAWDKGTELTVDLCLEMLQAGAPGLHFYLMNEIETGKRIIKRIKHKYK